jgi:hypothetical protein
MLDYTGAGLLDFVLHFLVVLNFESRVLDLTTENRIYRRKSLLREPENLVVRKFVPKFTLKPAKKLIKNCSQRLLSKVLNPGKIIKD